MNEPTTPFRVQLRRTKGWRMPPNTVKVDRSTRWGNPHPLDAYPREWPVDERRQRAQADFRADLEAGRLDFTAADVRRELWGKNLACWCPLPKPGESDDCHAAVLLEIAGSAGSDLAPQAQKRPDSQDRTTDQ
ncbi:MULTISPECIES: DUF4326 domain-containing protein [unclassified Methylocaldum]|jgi:hypothetical protein|uniref:DUF4326 domain-containing protein n=1 Tax=unclassified Methylocaldum TaxID=2622260 RepID=UPI0012EB28C2|nr:DUF4326 domain-containing protein [Methylocaldum sp. RMAD-M]MBP1151342.1 hypothetical protein [Methylocaldum sp. RMAD-M]MVF24007.1 DUF4326 domain-containing protein [Methylocaldum sp. BRCS4]